MTPDDPRHGTYAGHNAGCRDECCTTAARNYQKRRIYDRHNGIPRTVPAIGAQRRLRALAALGWTFGDIAQRTTITRQAIHEINRRPDAITTRNHLMIAEIYDDLSMQVPPPGRYSTRQRGLAARKGWVPPLAWDDIDDPNEQPTLGSSKRNGGHVLVEDAAWLADADESLTSVCTRLNTNPDTLWAACKRADRLDVFDKLADRELDGDFRRDMRRIKRGAA